MSFRSAFGRGVAMGIGRFAREADWILELDDFAPEVLRNRLRRPRTAGLIAQFANAQAATAASGLELPMVHIGSSPPSAGEGVVRSDEAQIGALAFEFYQSRGLQHFGTIGAPDSTLREQQRFAEFRRRADAAGLPCFDFSEWTGSGDTPRGDDQRRAAWLEQLPRRIGLLAYNDRRGMEALAACRDLGLRVPEEVAVIGVDDDDVYCHTTTPAMASIAQANERIGYAAGEMLHAMLEGRAPDPPVRLVPPLGLIERPSADIYAIDNPVVERALRVIRSRAASGLTVNGLLDELSVSRRLLELQFREHLQRTPAQEIRRVRLDHARTLLAQTGLPMEQIARRCGYPTASRLSQAFAAAFGLPPSDYRRRSRPGP